jgi:hypothetical protein
MSWTIKASPNLDLFKPLESDLMVGDYISLEQHPSHQLTDEDSCRYSENEIWQPQGRGGGFQGVWRIIETHVGGNPNRYRARVVNPGTNGIFWEFDIKNVPYYDKLDSYPQAIR